MRLFYGISIGMIIIMVVVIILALSQIANGETNVMLPLIVPTILAPLSFLPLFFASKLQTELKRRKANEN